MMSKTQHLVTQFGASTPILVLMRRIVLVAIVGVALVVVAFGVVSKSSISGPATRTKPNADQQPPPPNTIETPDFRMPINAEVDDAIAPFVDFCRNSLKV